MLPEIVPGIGRTEFNATVLAVLVAHALDAFTLSVPLVNVLSKLTSNEFVPCPVEIFTPAGTVHVYVVAPLTTATVYVADEVPRGHKPTTGPPIDPGTEGAAFNNKVFAGLDVQALLTVMLSVPLVKVLSKLTTNEFVPCPLIMLDPAGGVQVYPVAPEIAATEYVLLVLQSAVVLPLIVPGAASAVLTRLFSLHL